MIPDVLPKNTIAIFDKNFPIMTHPLSYSFYQMRTFFTAFLLAFNYPSVIIASKGGDVMETIQDKFFFHIYTEKLNYCPRLELNKTYFIGRNKNPFFAYYDSFKPSQNSAPVSLFSDYVQFARETIFEEIRKEYFPHLPSRQKCIWLVPIDDHLHESLAFWQSKINTPGAKIMKVKCSGKLHTTDQQYLNLHIGDLNYVREQSFRYWASCNDNIAPQNKECLFEGFLTPVSICENISDIITN